MVVPAKQAVEAAVRLLHVKATRSSAQSPPDEDEERDLAQALRTLHVYMNRTLRRNHETFLN